VAHQRVDEALRLLRSFWHLVCHQHAFMLAQAAGHQPDERMQWAKPTAGLVLEIDLASAELAKIAELLLLESAFLAVEEQVAAHEDVQRRAAVWQVGLGEIDFTSDEDIAGALSAAAKAFAQEVHRLSEELVITSGDVFAKAVRLIVPDARDLAEEPPRVAVSVCVEMLEGADELADGNALERLSNARADGEFFEDRQAAGGVDEVDHASHPLDRPGPREVEAVAQDGCRIREFKIETGRSATLAGHHEAAPPDDLLSLQPTVAAARNDLIQGDTRVAGRRSGEDWRRFRQQLLASSAAPEWQSAPDWIRERINDRFLKPIDKILTRPARRCRRATSRVTSKTSHCIARFVIAGPPSAPPSHVEAR
jgi:hypothetical protein